MDNIGQLAAAAAGAPSTPAGAETVQALLARLAGGANAAGAPPAVVVKTERVEGAVMASLELAKSRNGEYYVTGFIGERNASVPSVPEGVRLLSEAGAKPGPAVEMRRADGTAVVNADGSVAKKRPFPGWRAIVDADIVQMSDGRIVARALTVAKVFQESLPEGWDF